jgi:hypothetical protein
MRAWKKENQQAANRLVEIYFFPFNPPNRKFSPDGASGIPKSDFRPSCRGGPVKTGSGPGFGRVSFESCSSFAEQSRSGLEQHSNNTRTTLEQIFSESAQKTGFTARVTWFNRSL